MNYFNPRSPWGERLPHAHTVFLQNDFNPRSPWGERPCPPVKPANDLNFNPRSPWGERPSPVTACCNRGAFQSTLPVGGATCTTCVQSHRLPISIHAPRGGSDRQSGRAGHRSEISIHAPRGGSDEQTVQNRQKTRNFNPRSPWGERPLSGSIGDSFVAFQSTLPVGGATTGCTTGSTAIRISIHAPRGGSDAIIIALIGNEIDFNPRSPWGERPSPVTACCNRGAFQSTLPVGGATFTPMFPNQTIGFQSTLPVGGATRKVAAEKMLPEFQSTLPVGGATAKMHKFPAASLAKVSNFVGQAPGKAVPNRFKSRYSPHRFTKKPCEPPGNSCSPELRTTGSGYPPADRCSCSQNAQLSFHIDSPGSRSGGCPFPDP